MALIQDLQNRAENACELCGVTKSLLPYLVSPKSSEDAADHILICEACSENLVDPSAQPEYWRCLSGAVWNATPAVQVVTWRTLKQLPEQDWAADMTDSIYMDETTQEWADQGQGENTIHKDSNGQVLQDGDSVVILKDLDVKGANFVAKRGTVVKRISLVADNAGQIEGKVNDQHIVILTRFVRKA